MPEKDSGCLAADELQPMFDCDQLGGVTRDICVGCESLSECDEDENVEACTRATAEYQWTYSSDDVANVCEFPECEGAFYECRARPEFNDYVLCGEELSACYVAKGRRPNACGDDVGDLRESCYACEEDADCDLNSDGPERIECMTIVASCQRNRLGVLPVGCFAPPANE